MVACWEGVLSLEFPLLTLGYAAAIMNQRKLYYFDNNATTQVAPEVVESMMPFLTEYWGNPSSAYFFGKQVAKHVDEARAKVAGLINADPKEIIFTSCGTESNNTALCSALLTQPGKRHLITSAVEHSANINYGEFLQKQGYEVTFLPVESDGSLDLHLLDKTIRPDTAIVSMMWANNETGVIFPIEEIAALCQSKGVLFHTDAVQTPGKIKIDVKATGVDSLSLSAHAPVGRPSGKAETWCASWRKAGRCLWAHAACGRRARENQPRLP